MGRGFLSGIFWGGIVGVALLFVSSQALERQSLSFPKPEAAAVEVPGGSEFNQARPETDPVVPTADARPEGDSVAGVAVPDDSGNQPPVFDTSALEVPVPSTTQDAPETLGEAPEEVSDVAEPAPSSDRDIADTEGEALAEPENPGAAPEADTANVATPAVEPGGNDAPNVAETADTAPDVEDVGVAQSPTAEDAPSQPETEAAPQVASQVDAPRGTEAPAADADTPLPWETAEDDAAIDQAPDAPQLPEIASEPSLPPVGTDDASDAPEIAAVEPEEQPLPSFMVDLAEANAAQEAVENEVDPEPQEADAPVVAETEQAPVIVETDGTDSVLQPVETLTDDASNIVTDRPDASDGGSSLPVVRRFGDNSADEAEEDTAVLDTPAVVPADDAADEPGEAGAGPAIQVFGTEFEAEEGLPLMSIILVHTGGTALGADVIEALSPYVGFAVDAALPEAEDVARAYRDAGREVVMIPALPAGAAPQDIEQALTVNLERVPEAVAVMDVSGSSFQSDRDAVAQVVDVVADTGHGLITFPRGLNTAHQQAQRAGVPTGLIFRNLDGGGETQEQIRRSLDRAAFRARQDEAVILVGTTGSTMLSALTEWSLGNRAATVTIAPVSVALGG